MARHINPRRPLPAPVTVAPSARRIFTPGWATRC